MSSESGEFVLGQSVTREATAQTKRATAILSVRLPIEDILALEEAGEASGKTTAEIVREALSSYLRQPVRTDLERSVS